MKSKILVILFSLLINYSFGQDLNTLMKLHDYSLAFGCTNIAADTLLMKARIGKMHIKTAEQLIYLLRAAEHYTIKDYENSKLFIQKIGNTLRYPEYDNLKFFLQIGIYSNLKDIENTAKHFYIVSKYVYLDSNNLESIRNEIRNNYKRDSFDYSLSFYYYYHQRMKILNEIGFTD
jgi:hypothetical protein